MTTVNSTGDVCEYGDIRLVGGADQYEGRVEICINDQWGTVCDDNWDSTDASVVCNQLGHPTTSVTAHLSAYYGAGSDPIYLDNVVCTGSEATLISCISNPIASHNCDHSEDAGVRCEGQLIYDFQYPMFCFRVPKKISARCKASYLNSFAFWSLFV